MSEQEQRGRVRAILAVRGRARNILAITREALAKGTLGTAEVHARVGSETSAFFAAVDAGVDGRLLPEPSGSDMEALKSARDRAARALAEHVRALGDLVAIVDRMAAAELAKLGGEG